MLLRNFAVDVPGNGDSAELAVSNDGRTVYFSSRDPAEDPNSKSAYSRLYAVPADGSGTARVVAEKSGTSFNSPVVSPDGTRVAYLAVTAPLNTLGRTAVMVRDLKTGNTRDVATFRRQLQCISPGRRMGEAFSLRVRNEANRRFTRSTSRLAASPRCQPKGWSARSTVPAVPSLSSVKALICRSNCSCNKDPRRPGS